MRKRLTKSKKKKLTEEQQEARKRNKEIQMIGRQALGFDKMKIKGTKPRKLTPEEEYDQQIMKLYTQTKLTYTPILINTKAKPFVVDWEEAK